MKPTPEGNEAAAEFILPMRDVVHPENWDEWKEKGFRWYENSELREGETVLTAAEDATRSSAKRYNGVENVVTGDPFDQETDRPVRRAGQLGIYVRRSEGQ